MEHEPVPGSICSAVGHRMLSMHVVRCQHTEAVWYRLTVYGDMAEEVEVEHTEAMEFGPFDSENEIWLQCSMAVDRAMKILRPAT